MCFKSKKSYQKSGQLQIYWKYCPISGQFDFFTDNENNISYFITNFNFYFSNNKNKEANKENLS